ncbi:MAG: hypothetical protein QOJ19_2970 [Acidimicrobiia bacterium]|jgi:ABC-type transport system substrate-binding protein|nr:hypothetical protein [Acidimicrobiia bacterium]
MDLSKRQKLFIAGGLTVGTLLGGYGLASAQSSSSSTTSASADAADGPDEAAPYQSSITVPGPANGTDPSGTASESDESASLAGLAKVTADDAKAAAVAAHPGTARSVELEEEDGNVVYAVTVDTASGSLDVKVDAGNAKVLAAHSDDGHDGPDENGGTDTETNDGPED